MTSPLSSHSMACYVPASALQFYCGESVQAEPFSSVQRDGGVWEDYPSGHHPGSKHLQCHTAVLPVVGWAATSQLSPGWAWGCPHQLGQVKAAGPTNPALPVLIPSFFPLFIDCLLSQEPKAREKEQVARSLGSWEDLMVLCKHQRSEKGLSISRCPLISMFCQRPMRPFPWVSRSEISFVFLASGVLGSPRPLMTLEFSLYCLWQWVLPGEVQNCLDYQQFWKSPDWFLCLKFRSPYLPIKFRNFTRMYLRVKLASHLDRYKMTHLSSL